MPSSRGTEMPQQQQRQSPRAPLHLRQASSGPNGVLNHHHRGSRPKPDDNHRRSPRSPLHEIPTVGNQRKRGTRVVDLETKLDHAKEELRMLKAQLASAEAAKRDAQHELEETKKMIPCARDGAGEQAVEENASSTEMQQNDQEENVEPPPDEAYSPVEEEEENKTHVVAGEMAQEKNEGREGHVGSPLEEKGGEAEAPVSPPSSATKLAESQETVESTEEAAKLAENAGVAGLGSAENAGLKAQTQIAEAEAAAARARGEEMALKLTLAGEELAKAKAVAAQLQEQLESAEGARASLEAEMKRMRVQTEQWRKAAEAAAAVLTPAGEANCPRVATRCGSMDKHVGAAAYEAAAGSGFSGLWSPLAAVDAEEGPGGGKRKGGGIRVFGDLWKRKGQHQQKP